MRSRARASNGSGLTLRMWVLIMSLIALAISALLFGLIMDNRVDDSEARAQVKMENDALTQVLILLQQANVLETNILQQKEHALRLEGDYQFLKEWITINMMNITNINGLTDLATQINSTISNITIALDERILLLEKHYQDVLSHAIYPNTATIVKSGACTLQGLTSTSVNYDYKTIDVNGLRYQYYVFNKTNGVTIDIDNTGFTIENCSPALYVGSNNVAAASPVFTSQVQDVFGEDESDIIELKVENQHLQFLTTSFMGTKAIELKKDLTHFISFF